MISQQISAKRGMKGQQLYFLNTENCLIFASAVGDDSERMRGRTRRGTPLHRLEWENVLNV